jgi:hypothetical protein
VFGHVSSVGAACGERESQSIRGRQGVDGATQLSLLFLDQGDRVRLGRPFSGDKPWRGTPGDSCVPGSRDHEVGTGSVEPCAHVLWKAAFASLDEQPQECVMHDIGGDLTIACRSNDRALQGETVREVCGCD